MFQTKLILFPSHIKFLNAYYHRASTYLMVKQSILENNYIHLICLNINLVINLHPSSAILDDVINKFTQWYALSIILVPISSNLWWRFFWWTSNGGNYRSIKGTALDSWFCYRAFPWVVMPRLHESGPFQGSYGQPRETPLHLLGPI